MTNNVKINWYPGARKKLLDAPNNITYAVARQTLDKTYPHIPLSRRVNVVHMRQTSMSAGVRGNAGHYYIGSYTDYAKYVWVMPNSTNWTEPGTFGKWYEEIWKKQGKAILNSSVERNKLK